MTRPCYLQTAARQSARLVFLALSGLALLTIFAAERAFAQAEGAPVVTETGKAQSGRQTTGQEGSNRPAQEPQKVEEAPYPGGPGRRVEEAPYPGTLGGTGELQRLKRSPGSSDSGGTSIDPPAR
ncbi:MAG TPA: hypothetical protein VFK79_03310 [Xanthobacteraceae bacterium]|nr:hypothetical protein [Xanthobacteraceae bacterium]